MTEPRLCARVLGQLWPLFRSPKGGPRRRPGFDHVFFFFSVLSLDFPRDIPYVFAHGYWLLIGC